MRQSGDSSAAAPIRFTHTAPAADFSVALRRVADANPGRDIVVVAEGARLPFATDERLAKAAHAEPAIAAAIPMCDISPLYSLVDEAHRPLSPGNEVLVDRSAYCMGLRVYYEVPRLHPVCAYLRRDALEAFLASDPAPSSPQEFLDAFVSASAARGRACVLCDYVYVGYAGAPLEGAASVDRIELQAFVQQHPLGGLRRVVNEGLREGLPPVSTPGLDARPVQLHIMHFWGGGLDRWVRDFGRADPSRVNLILATYRIGETGGQRVVLYSDPAAMIPVRTWDIARAIRSTATTSLEYRQILRQVIEEFDVEAVIVSSLIGHSLDALATGLKTIVVCHDFHPVCQAINPRFRGVTCTHCTIEDLRECGRDNPLNRIFTDLTSDEWHAMRTRFTGLVLEHGIAMVVPSQSVATTLRQLDPRLAAVPMPVIGHGMDMDAPRIAYPARAAGDRMRLVVLGRLSPQKGIALLRDAAPGLAPFADVTIVGGGGNGAALARECGWKCIEKYEVSDLPRILGEIAPHAVLLASVVPETFSYTLSEAWALGIPPVASALGSFKERIVEGESGFLFEPGKDSLVEVIRRLHSTPGSLEAVAKFLASRPAGRTTAQMVADYDALIPMAARPVARFRVAIGRETALTEPYRHLNQAYAELKGAYDHLDEAYARTAKAWAETRDAYDHAHAERDALNAGLNEFFVKLAELRLARYPWRVTKVPRLMEELRSRRLPGKEKPE
ncbi:MAG: glycosyltransferase [Usitatibacter sp.]